MTGTIHASGLIRITKSVQLLVGLELDVLFMFTEAVNESKMVRWNVEKFYSATMLLFRNVYTLLRTQNL